MKFLCVLLLAAFALATSTFALFAASAASVHPLPAPAAPPTEPVLLRPAGPVAVVELFTSEGCSSCPKADRLLVELAERDDDRVLALSFHVDYWNRLGWTDPYSDAAYSERQRAYARTFRAGRVYTPQMIVNGRDEFVGSRRHKAHAAIKDALTEPASATVSVRARAEDGALVVAYRVEDAPDDAVLHLALVQRRAEQAVLRGENEGKTLAHANVVRLFETVPARTGTRTLPLPDGLRPDAVSLVAYVQDPATMQVYGASHAEAGLRAAHEANG